MHWGLALDLVAAPASKVYIDRMFSVCVISQCKSKIKQMKA